MQFNSDQQKVWAQKSQLHWYRGEEISVHYPMAANTVLLPKRDAFGLCNKVRDIDQLPLGS